MKFRINKFIVFFGIIFILAFSLRAFKLSSFEFKDDQLDAIEMGIDTRNASFLVAHGVPSGGGVNNPPFLLYLVGIITFFTEDPFWISAIFLLISSLGLFVALHYFCKYLPLPYAMLSSLILAFSAAFTTYTVCIWPQCLLPFFMIFYHKILYRLIEESKGVYFFYLAIITAVVSQIHLSGYFLFPSLILIGILFRDKIGLKVFLKSVFVMFVISLPYLYHLFFENELVKFIAFADGSGRSGHWKIFREHIRMSSFEYFRYYFRYDLSAVLDASVGKFKFILYPLSCVLILLFVSALVYYLFRLIKSRKLFDISPEARQKYPLVFQISAFLVVVVTLSYLLCRVQTPPHYLIILFPSYSIMSGFFAWKLWRFFWAKVIISSAIFATAYLVLAVLIFIKSAGGHPHEYGPHYGTLLKWKEQVWQAVPRGYCPDLLLEGENKFDKETISSVIMSQHHCPRDVPKIPLRLSVVWDEQTMRYRSHVGPREEKQ